MWVKRGRGHKAGCIVRCGQRMDELLMGGGEHVRLQAHVSVRWPADS